MEACKSMYKNKTFLKFQLKRKRMFNHIKCWRRISLQGSLLTHFSQCDGHGEWKALNWETRILGSSPNSIHYFNCITIQSSNRVERFVNRSVRIRLVIAILSMIKSGCANDWSLLGLSVFTCEIIINCFKHHT